MMNQDLQAWGEIVRTGGNERNENVPTRIPLRESTTFFGRDSPSPKELASRGYSHTKQCMLFLPYASSTHFAIRRGEQGGYTITDYSRNGTILNWVLIGYKNTRPLLVGDEISIKYKQEIKVMFKFGLIEEVAASASSSSAAAASAGSTSAHTAMSTRSKSSRKRAGDGESEKKDWFSDDSREIALRKKRKSTKKGDTTDAHLGSSGSSSSSSSSSRNASRSFLMEDEGAEGEEEEEEEEEQEEEEGDDEEDSLLTTTLSDSLLTKIFFSSGYLSSYWPNVSRRLLVNKQLNTLGRHAIMWVDASSTMINSPRSIRVLPRLSSSIVVLDLDFTFTEFSPMEEDFDDLAQALSTNLRWLTLRGSMISDRNIQSLSCLSKLRHLDLSKASRVQAELVTYACGPHLAQLQQLEWLNLAMTKVTDACVKLVANSLPRLVHLGLQCCKLLTDDCIVNGIRSLSQLQTLDVNCCSLFTNRAFHSMGDQQASPIRHSLVSLMCSFLPEVTDEAIDFILQERRFPLLKKLEFRGGQPVRGSIVERAKTKLLMHIFLHKDQYNYPASELPGMEAVGVGRVALIDEKLDEERAALAVAAAVAAEAEEDEEGEEGEEEEEEVSEATHVFSNESDDLF